MDPFSRLEPPNTDIRPMPVMFEGDPTFLSKTQSSTGSNEIHLSQKTKLMFLETGSGLPSLSSPFSILSNLERTGSSVFAGSATRRPKKDPS
jgi:hypothetical protein